MILAKLAQAVLKLIMPKILEHLINVFKVDKVDKLVNYMELPNDADLRIDKLEERPVIDPDEWEDVKETIKILKRKKAFKRKDG